MQVPIPDDWDGVSFCRWAVCWPDSIKWKSILYGLLEMPNQGRFWDFKTGNFLELRTLFRDAYDYNFNLKEVIMACGDTGIAEGLQAIAVSLQSLATATATANANSNAYASAAGGDCCASTIINQGGGVQAIITLPDETTIPMFGTEPPIGIPPGEWPEGFTSREEYDVDKCQVANLIIDGLISSLRSLGMITGAETGAALAFLIIASITASIIFPPAAVGIVAAAFGVGTVIFTVLLQAVNYITDNREEWVCALYDGDSTEEILAVIAGLIAAMVAFLAVPTLVGGALTTIILTLLSSDTLNQLFKLQAHLSYPDADCSGCGEGPCLDFDEDLDGFVKFAWVNENNGNGSVQWGESAGNGLMNFTGLSNQDVSVRRVQTAQCHFEWGVDVVAGPVTHVAFALYDDDTSENLYVAGTMGEGPHPGLEADTNPAKNVTHIGFYFGVGPDFDPFDASISQVCIYPVSAFRAIRKVYFSTLCCPASKRPNGKMTRRPNRPV